MNSRTDYWRDRRKSGRMAEALRKHYAVHPGLRNEQTKAWRKANPEKHRAQNIINCRISRGTLKRQPCSVCGNPKSHAHHADYSKPLEVNWLCALCHKQAHKTK